MSLMREGGGEEEGEGAKIRGAFTIRIDGPLTGVCNRNFTVASKAAILNSVYVIVHNIPVMHGYDKSKVNFAFPFLTAKL